MCKSKSLLKHPSKEEIEAFEAERKAYIAAQKEALKAKKLQSSIDNIEHIIAGKKRKLLEAGVDESCKF